MERKPDKHRNRERYRDKGLKRKIRVGGFIIEKENEKRLQASNKYRKGRGTNGLTFFGVTGSILAGMTHHPIRLVPWSVFQHVIPEIRTRETGHWLEFTPDPQVEPKTKNTDPQNREESPFISASKSV